MSWITIALIAVIAGVWFWLLSSIDLSEELEELQRELEEGNTSSNNGS